jgi:hypothetical protein
MTPAVTHRHAASSASNHGGFVKTSQTVATALIVFVAEMPTWANDAGRTRPADTRLSSTVHGEIVARVPFRHREGYMAVQPR